MTDFFKLGQSLMRAQAESLGFPQPQPDPLPSNVVPIRALHAVPDRPEPVVASWGEPLFPPTLDDYLNGRGAPRGTDPVLAIDFATQARDLLPAGGLRDRLTAIVVEAEVLYGDDKPEAS